MPLPPFLACPRRMPGLARTVARGPELKAGASVREHRLRNGLRVLIAERKGDPVVASLLFYRVGSRNEREREAGVSHFLEHMMFKGSRGYAKGMVDRVTTELGGQNNAYTGYDHTAYWFELASDRWEAALAIEADRMEHLLLDPDEFHAERAVVLEELAMGEDDPWRVLARRVEAMVFGRHPYGRPIIGLTETLEAMTPGDMRDYYERFYHPGNATLVLCGDVTSKAGLGAVRKHFGRAKAGMERERADCWRSPLREPGGEVRVTMSWDDPAKRLVIAWPTTGVGTEVDYAMDVALTALASGRRSRLHQRLVVREGLATGVSGTNDARVEGGAFWLYVDAAQDAEPAEVERVLAEEVAAVAKDKLPAAELKRAKNLLRAGEAFDGEAVSDLAEELGEYAVDADWRLAFDGGARHEKIRAPQLRDHIARYLTPTRRVVGWCLPGERPSRSAAEGVA